MLLGQLFGENLGGRGQQAIIVRCGNCLTNKCASGGVKERLHLGRLGTLERELHFGLLEMLLDL